MYFLPNGLMAFSSANEMYYNLFLEIGLSINRDNYLYDQDTGIVLKYKDKYIKANIFDNTEIYAGKNDILFDPANNYNLMETLFGYYIDKQAAEGNDIGFIARYIEDYPKWDNPNVKPLQRIVIKRKMQDDIYSNYYNKLYLGFIDIIFKLSD